MDLIGNLALGFGVAFSTSTLLACFVGVFLGTLVGVLPGIGPLTGISLLLPLTYHQGPIDALVMLAGIYYGAQYGGSTAAILLNLPGTAATSVTCLDGYPMSRQGRGGVALFMTTIASFLGGSFSIVLMAAFAPLMVQVALDFGPSEYFSMMVLGLVAASTMSGDSPFKGIAMVVVGLIIGLVGTDIASGWSRFTFGRLELLEGISVVVVAMGLFGISEILLNFTQETRTSFRLKDFGWRSMLPTRDDVRRSWMPTARGSAIGAVIGILPGAGAAIAAFISYAVEKRVSSEPERFGRGAIEGVVAPEASNNSAAQAAFIPTMALGIPGNAVMALMLGALMVHGIVPGPLVLVQQPALFWGLIASFWIGNVLLVILNLPLIGVWMRILAVPYHILFPTILLFICLGAYSIRYNVFDVYMVLAFGVLGFLLRSFGYPVAALLLGFILGPLMEENLRRALLLSRGDGTVFFTQPISAALLALTALLIVLSIWRWASQRRRDGRRAGAASE